MDPLPVSVSVAASTEVDEDKRDAPRDGPPREKDREARESRESIGIDVRMAKVSLEGLN